MSRFTPAVVTLAVFLVGCGHDPQQGPSCADAGLSCGDHSACSEATGTAACGCDDGYQDNDGDGTCTVVCAANPCSGHGTCSDATGTALCTCSNGFIGATCAVCGPGTQDNDGDGTCTASCAATGCSGHGTCSDASGTAVCGCQPGYSGAQCASCASGSQDNDHDGTCAGACAASTCSGHGTCADGSGATICACSAGYTGAACSECAAGYQDHDGDGTCEPACVAGTCSGHGSCSDATGAAVCACTNGYSGASCNACGSGLQDNDHDGTCTTACAAEACSGKGTCDDAGGTLGCACEPGYDGADCSTCAAGYQDHVTAGVCMPGCTADTCSGKGTCVEVGGMPTCACGPGYTGADCTSCAAGYQDGDGNGTCERDCSDVQAACGTANATCAVVSGAPVCQCNPGAGGFDCATPVRFLDPSATGTGDGTSWTNAATTWTSAASAANSCVSSGNSVCELWVKQGTYYAYGAPGNMLTLPGSVKAYGGFTGTERDRSQRSVDPSLTVLDGHEGPAKTQQVQQVLGVAGANSGLDGFTITGSNGAANANMGGGVFVTGNNFTMNDCVVTGNEARNWGGGLAASGSITLTITHSTFANNKCTFIGGGGVALVNGVTATISDSTFDSNTCGEGGGIVGWYSTATLTNVSMYRNSGTTANGGGAVFSGNSPSQWTFNNFRAAYNLSNLGGALSMDSVAINGCEIVGNVSLGGAGGVFIGGVLSLRSCTVVGNIGNGPGGIQGGDASSSVVNSIVFGNINTSASNNGVNIQTGLTLPVTYSDVGGGYTGTGNLNADPVFERAPSLWDRATANGTTTTVTVNAVSRWAVGDPLVLNGDGVLRTVTAINSSTLTFTPAAASATFNGESVTQWLDGGSSFSLLLESSSPCIDAANGTLAPATDLDGNPRVDQAGVTNLGTGTPAYVDIGAHERQ